VKILDFGISRFLEVDLDRAQACQLAGTPEFMAPEQVTMPDQVDGRADIYALGVLLYEMLCARCPHSNDDRRLLLHQLVHDAPAPLDRPVPADLERLLFDRMLAKSRDDRLQTMAEVKAALDDLATSLRAGTSDSLFAFEDTSLEIDVAFFDDPQSGPVPAARAASEPGARAASEAAARAASDAGARAASEAAARAASDAGARAASEAGARAASEAGARAASEAGARAASEAAARAASEAGARTQSEARARAVTDADRAVQVTAPRSGSAPILALARATMRAPVPARHGPRSLWLIAALLAATAGGAFWFAEYQQPQMLGELRRVAWALGAVLVAIYTLGWIACGVRAIGSWFARAKTEADRA
jgi:hypothetical protein